MEIWLRFDDEKAREEESLLEPLNKIVFDAREDAIVAMISLCNMSRLHKKELLARAIK